MAPKQNEGGGLLRRIQSRTGIKKFTKGGAPAVVDDDNTTGDENNDNNNVRRVVVDNSKNNNKKKTAATVATAKEAFEITLPTGNIGLILSKATPPVIKTIKENSSLIPLYPELTTGMLIDTITLKDGTTHYGKNGKEITLLLKEHKDSDGRVMRIIRPGMKATTTPELTKTNADDLDNSIYYDDETDDDDMPPEVFATIPGGKSLGMKIQKGSTPPMVQGLAKNSCLREMGVCVGMVVDTLEVLLRLDDDDASKKKTKTKRYYEMTSERLTSLLENHHGRQRTLCFIDPDMIDLTPTPEETKEGEKVSLECIVHLPVGSLGAGFNTTTIGRLPNDEKQVIVVTDMDKNSCLRDFDVSVGMIVDTLTLGDGMIHYELIDLDYFMDILRQHKEETGKILRLVHPDHASTMLTKRPPYEGPDEVTCHVDLSAGTLGGSFHGAPPVLFRLDDDSPLRDVGICVGMMVDTIDINGTKHYEIDHWELNLFLQDYPDSRMILRFVAPHYVITPPPKPTYIETFPEPESLEIELPSSGTTTNKSSLLGLSFAGTEPICIKMVRPDSELAVYDIDGYGINQIFIPATAAGGGGPTTNKKKQEQNLVELRHIKQVRDVLIQTKDIPGRILYLKKPELYPKEFAKKEKEEAEQKEVVVCLTKDELECKQKLLKLKFEEDAILQSLQYYRDLGQTIYTDDVMTHIIDSY